jgi:hypothetical protein
MKKRILLNLLCVLYCAVLSQSLMEAQAQGRRSSSQQITGTVVGIGGRLGVRTRQITIKANPYKPPNQVRELNDALGRGGQDELLRALSGMDAGRIQVGTGIGVTANAIIADPWGEGGTKLTVFYQRNISFYEMRYGARSENYPIGYAEIFIDQNGRGQGTLIPAARVRLRDGNTWEVEDFGVLPARLMGLRARGSVLAR